jgi:cobalt/nickel transport system permease protein
MILALVLLVEGLVFGDGGITSMGANLINMGICGGFVGYFTWKALYKPYMGSDGILTGSGILSKWWSIGVASWLAIFLSAILAALEIGLANFFPIRLGLLWMGSYYAVIGIIEAIVTVIVISSLEKVRPDLLGWNKLKRAQTDDLESDNMEVPSK